MKKVVASRRRRLLIIATAVAATTAIVLISRGMVLAANRSAERLGANVGNSKKFKPLVKSTATPTIPNLKIPTPQPQTQLAPASPSPTNAPSCVLQSGETTGDYASFPAATTTPDGRIIAVWRTAQGHQSGSGAILMSELDEERTECAWSAPRAILTGDMPRTHSVLAESQLLQMALY